MSDRQAMDWNQARAFAATAAAGSLSAAARKLRLTQPTLSRQIAALEASLGATLFERVGKRLVLTDTGLGLVEHAQAMMAAADAMALSAAGKTEDVAGRVTISASDGFAAYLLPDIVARIRKDVPQITVVVIASNALSDLRRREADIAIRHVRPTEPELFGKLIRETTAHFYAATSWIRRHGAPTAIADLAPGALIGYAPIEEFSAQLGKIDIVVDSAAFRIASENSVVVWEMVRRGLGVGVMLREIAARTTGVVRVLPQAPVITAPIWLVAHRELRTSRRVRLVFEILAEELSALPLDDAPLVRQRPDRNNASSRRA